MRSEAFPDDQQLNAAYATNRVISMAQTAYTEAVARRSQFISDPGHEFRTGDLPVGYQAANLAMQGAEVSVAISA